MAASTQTPSEPPQPVRFYPYDFVTEDARSSWNNGGRQSVVNAGVEARDREDAIKLAIIYQELVRAGLDGHLDPQEAGSVVKSILEADHSDIQAEEGLIPFNAPETFCDSLFTLPPEDSKSPRFKPLVFATNIPAATMREVMDIDMLVQLGLVRSTFERKAIRHQTNVLYRQSNYNLLREETEGYAKLTTELFTTSSNELPSAEVVTGTFERVKALIGTFDLDVGRVLDITLDVFAAILIKHYRFVVKYLRVSSWWPQPSALERAGTDEFGTHNLPQWAAPSAHGSHTLDEEETRALAEARSERDTEFWKRVREVGLTAFFELGGRRISPDTLEASKAASNLDIDLTREWIEKTNTLPPRGNKVAAQVLGFKLRFYSSMARDPNDTLPHNLLALAALLIKIGFISLADLYPHLWPEDEGIDAVKEQKMKEKTERERLNRPGGGSKNALMTAGALPDDTVPAAVTHRAREVEAAKAAEAKDNKPADRKNSTDSAADMAEPADQKFQLLKCLLCIGAIPESLFLLGRFPWLLDGFPDLPDYIHRIFHHSLHKVYGPVQPPQDGITARQPHTSVDLEQSSVAKNEVCWVEPPPRRALRWAQLDKSDPLEETDYRFYWDDWVDNVPVCQTVDDVFTFCDTFLNISGFKIGLDPSLLVKLARIGFHSLKTDASESNRTRWIALTKRLLVPALSLTRRNSGTVAEVWSLLKNFQIPVRYNIYAEWFTGQTSRLPDLQAAFDLARAETKDVLKRISKKNTKQMARALAKVATSAPGVVFSVAFNQIESYDNLSEVIVDCARFFTDLGYDVLTWSLMNSLGARGRNRVQADGMLTSKWLSALSLFAGSVFKRYQLLNPTPVLQYVADQLRKGNSTDLVVLEQITFAMAGIVSDASFNDAQAISMAGGPLLRQQTMLQLLDRRYGPGMQTSSRRLMRALAGPQLTGQLLISIAQRRQMCIYDVPEEDANLKLLGNLHDELHRILTQYIDFLRSNLSASEFDAVVPPLESLIKDYGVEPSIAFWMYRGSTAAAIIDHDKRVAAEKAASPRTEAKASDGVPKQDVEMTGAGSPEKPTESKKPDQTGDVEMTDGSPTDEKAGATGATPQPTPTEPPYPWHPVLKSVMEAVRPVLPPQIWKHLSEPFYVSFWQLSIGDMLVPTSSYDDEQRRLKTRIVELNADKSTDPNVIKFRERQKKDIYGVLDRLPSELKDQVSVYSQIRSRLMKEKDFWFAETRESWEAISVALLESCFIPRISLSSIDALYTFRMLRFLHSTGAKNFRTIKVIDEFFNAKRLTSLIFQFTAKEAEYFGRFLNDLLKFLGSWHIDKALYEKEAYGAKKDLPGFRMGAKDSPFLEYEDFRRIMQKWHFNLHQALKNCFSGGEYMHIRNAIVVLRAVVTVFPAIDWMGRAQGAGLTELIKSDSRDDLKLALRSLLGLLRRQEKNWVMPQAFSLVSSLTTDISRSTNLDARTKLGLTARAAHDRHQRSRPPLYRARTMCLSR